MGRAQESWGPQPLAPDVPTACQAPAMGSMLSVPAPLWAETSLNGVSVTDNLDSPNYRGL